VYKCVWQLARQLSGDAIPPFDGFNEADLGTDDQRDLALAILHAVGVSYGLLEIIEKVCARTAGRLGAGYPELAGAWKVTRQGARRRWPDAVPTERSDVELRHALTRVVMEVSNNSDLDPATTHRLIKPVTEAARAQLGSDPHAVAEAASSIIGAQPIAEADVPVLAPAMRELIQALGDYRGEDDLLALEDGGWHGSQSPADGTWQRFFHDRKQ
jgi:hypothetical protein